MVTTTELSEIIRDTANPVEMMLATNALVNGVFFAMFIIAIIVIVFLSARAFGNTMLKSLLAGAWTGALLSVIGWVMVYDGVHGVPTAFTATIVIFACVALGISFFHKDE